MSAGAAAFAGDYVTARLRFREAAARAGCLLLSYPLAARGPQGEELAIDVALLPAQQARRALVVSSGTHGVEGYFGSAVQLSLLSQLAALRDAAAPVSLVLIHAVNPFGFAHKRRVNEDNVDQNRNFVLDGRAFAGAPELYRTLAPLLHPTRVPGRFEALRLRLVLAGLRHGFPQAKNAIAQGQYEFERGLFFGGRAPSASQQILRGHLREWLGRPERVLHIDLHTGLGAWGSYALCVDLPREHPRVARLAQEFGAAYVQGFDTQGVLYEIQGGLGRWLEQRFEGTQYDCLLAEFGTYPGLDVLAALRFDNCVRQYASERPELVARARDRLFEIFCPASPAWREQVVASGLAIVRSALSALAHDEDV
jgi:Protein of unknown function (DUF2817)